MNILSNKNNIWHDPTLISLITTNAIVIILALVNQWQLSTVLWIYWWQSVIIGFFAFIRLLQMKKPRNSSESRSSFVFIKFFIAFFFVASYGLFHFVYSIFIFAIPEIVSSIISHNSTNTMSLFNPNGYTENAHTSISSFFGLIVASEIFLPVVLFFINHLFSYIYYRRERTYDNISKILITPYSRIVPMHISLMFAMFVVIIGKFLVSESLGYFISTVLPLMLFLILKTYIDISSHIKLHNPKEAAGSKTRNRVKKK